MLKKSTDGRTSGRDVDGANKDHKTEDLKYGDRVTVHGKHTGTVKYIGPLDDSTTSSGLYVGVHLDDQIGSTHNGVVHSKRYFYCPRGHGIMTKYKDVARIVPAKKRPSLKGNKMFPSFAEIQERRKQRSLMDPDFDLGPMYSVKKKEQDKPKHSSRSEKKSDSKHHTTKEQEIQQDPPQTLVTQWSSQYFGGGKDGEAKARTLYKLHVAYQQGQVLKRMEEDGDLSSSEYDESFDDTDSTKPKQIHWSHKE